jgi:hypothetical protein
MSAGPEAHSLVAPWRMWEQGRFICDPVLKD